MSSESSPPENESYRRGRSWFAVIIVGLFIGTWMLDVAAEQEIAPPWPIFIIVLIVMGALHLLRLLSLVVAVERRPLLSTSVERRLGPKLVWQLLQLYWAPLLLLFSVACAAIVLWWIPQLRFSVDSYRGVTILWALSFMMYLLAIHHQAIRWQWSWQRFWQAEKRWVLIVSGLLGVAFLLRVWRLDAIPFTLGGDEASQGLEAIRVLDGKLRNPFSTGWLGVPTMSFYYNAITISLIGPTIWALRFAWVIVGSATVGLTFLLVRRLFNKEVALITAVLLATYHYHIHFSRLGSNQIADPFFLVLALWLLYRAMDKQHLVNWALTGGVTGVAFYFYAGARLTPVIIIAVLAYHFLRQPRRFLQTHWLGIVVMAGGFLIVAGPMLQYAIRFPDNFNARLNQVGIVQSGWLEREVDIRNQSMWAILFDQFERAFFAFNYYSDRTVWYGLRQPLFDPLFGFLFLLGLIYATLRLLSRDEADARLAPMVAWWWGGMFLGGMLTESPPSSQRLITLSVPACFFIGWLLWELVQQAKRWWNRIPAQAIVVVTVAMFSFVSLNTYFVQHTPQRIYGGRHAELATVIAPTLRELAPDHYIYFAGVPWMYWGFATLPYLVPDAEAVDVHNPFETAADPSLVTPSKGGVFVFLPQREDELLMVARTFPDGETRQFHSPVDDRLMVTLYIVPPGG